MRITMNEPRLVNGIHSKIMIVFKHLNLNIEFDMQNFGLVEKN